MCGYRTPKNKEGTIEWPIYKIKRRLMLKKIIRIKQNKSLQFETFNKNFRWACGWSKLLYAFRSNQHFSFVIVWDKNMVVERGISDVKALTSSIFHNPKHIYIYIYIYYLKTETYHLLLLRSYWATLAVTLSTRFQHSLSLSLLINFPT